MRLIIFTALVDSRCNKCIFQSLLFSLQLYFFSSRYNRNSDLKGIRLHATITTVHKATSNDRAGSDRNNNNTATANVVETTAAVAPTLVGINNIWCSHLHTQTPTWLPPHPRHPGGGDKGCRWTALPCSDRCRPDRASSVSSPCRSMSPYCRQL